MITRTFGAISLSLYFWNQMSPSGAQTGSKSSSGGYFHVNLVQISRGVKLHQCTDRCQIQRQISDRHVSVFLFLHKRRSVSIVHRMGRETLFEEPGIRIADVEVNTIPSLQEVTDVDHVRCPVFPFPYSRAVVIQNVDVQGVSFGSDRRIEVHGRRDEDGSVATHHRMLLSVRANRLRENHRSGVVDHYALSRLLHSAEQQRPERMARPRGHEEVGRQDGRVDDQGDGKRLQLPRDDGGVMAQHRIEGSQRPHVDVRVDAAQQIEDDVAREIHAHYLPRVFAEARQEAAVLQEAAHPRVEVRVGPQHEAPVGVQATPGAQILHRLGRQPIVLPHEVQQAWDGADRRQMGHGVAIVVVDARQKVEDGGESCWEKKMQV